MSEWTRERLEAAKARCEAATPGPWVSTAYHDDDHGPHIETEEEVAVCVCSLDVPEHRANGAFVAHARADLPAALEALATVTVQRDALYDTASLLALALRYGNDDVPAALAALERVLDPQTAPDLQLGTWPTPGELDPETEREAEAARARFWSLHMRSLGVNKVPWPEASDHDAWRLVARPFVLREVHLRTELGKLTATKAVELEPVLMQLRATDPVRECLAGLCGFDEVPSDEALLNAAGEAFSQTGEEPSAALSVGRALETQSSASVDARAARARAAFEVAGGPITPARKEVRLAWQAVVRAVDASRPGLTEEQRIEPVVAAWLAYFGAMDRQNESGKAEDAQIARELRAKANGMDKIVADVVYHVALAKHRASRGEVAPPPPAPDPTSLAVREALDDERDERMLRGQADPPIPDRLAAARAEQARLAVDVHRYDGGDRPQSPPAGLIRDERAAWARVRALESEASATLETAINLAIEEVRGEIAAKHDPGAGEGHLDYEKGQIEAYEHVLEMLSPRRQ